MSTVWQQSGEILRCPDDPTKIAAEDSCPCLGPPLKCKDTTVLIPDSFQVDASDNEGACCTNRIMSWNRVSEQRLADCFNYSAFDYDAGAMYEGLTDERDPILASRLQANGGDFCNFIWGLAWICCDDFEDGQWRIRLLFMNNNMPLSTTSICELMADCSGDTDTDCQTTGGIPNCQFSTLNSWSAFETTEPLTTDWLSFDKTYFEEFATGMPSFHAGPGGGVGNCDWRSVAGNSATLRLSA